MRSWITRPLGAVLVAAAVAVAATGGIVATNRPVPTVTATPTPTSSPGSCDRSAGSAAALTTAFSAATPGQVVCLTASVDYGTFAAGAKSAPGVTVTAGAGINAIMRLSFNGASNVTVDGTLNGGTLTTSTSQGNGLLGALPNVTIRNMTFRRELDVEPNAGSSVLLDGLTFGGSTMSSSSSSEHMIGLYGNGAGSAIRNSTLTGAVGSGGNSPDGIRADGSNWMIGPDNRFVKFIDTGGNHTDVIQMCCGGAVSGNGSAVGPTNNDIYHNIFDQTVTGPANDGNKISAFIGIWDSAGGIDITDNVFTGRGTDQLAGLLSISGGSFVHNTAWRAAGQPCGSFNITCGSVDSGNKSGDDVTTGFRFGDNVYAGADQVGGGITSDHNLVAFSEPGTGNVVGQPVFIGGTVPNPASRANFCLAPGSPGKGIASDGGDPGITGC